MQQPQSHFGAKPKSVSRPLALRIWEIWYISSADSAKSKMSIFSDSRSIFEVRGIAETFCCTSQRRQTCAAGLPWVCPIRAGLVDQGHGESRDADVPGHAELLDTRQRA